MHYDRVTPLHMACLKGNIQIVNVQSIDNSTPLCDASAGGNIECVKILLEAGAWVNPPLLLSTPLHEASLREGAKVLLSYGANIYQKDLNGRKPRQLCDPNSDLALFLLLCETQPKSLKLCCRLAIIKHLGASSLKCLASLPIPSLILRYLE
ncbi:Ankyrin repeat and SOCS box protein 13 [Armadillidium nasatum]|uniref:Ankyrin repeat and SOCS box protein 13 n=1 Tax=Armadillidium nasatum TaxID=96803 RepID=A0A5N5SXL8_9CRUS|nr:Ankyrin repeat and SOCS box protein 13 [Armadillidium nasatum]